MLIWLLKAVCVSVIMARRLLVIVSSCPLLSHPRLCWHLRFLNSYPTPYFAPSFSSFVLLCSDFRCPKSASYVEPSLARNYRLFWIWLSSGLYFHEGPSATVSPYSLFCLETSFLISAPNTSPRSKVLLFLLGSVTAYRYIIRNQDFL